MMGNGVIFANLTRVITGEGHCVQLPGDVWSGGLGKALPALVNRLGSAAGVVLLHEDAADRIGWPTQRVDAPEDHPAAVSARDNGWEMSGAHVPWSIATKDGRKLHIARWTDVAGPLRLHTSVGTAMLLETWHQWIGQPWHTSSGGAGLAVLRQHATGVKAWRSDRGPADGRPAFEDVWSRQTWQAPRPASPPPYVIGYDTVRAGLAALGSAELSGYPLVFAHNESAPVLDRPIQFDPKRAGWWLAEIAPWGDDRLPHPAGYADGETLRWITTPTMTLLDWLAERGEMGKTTVYQSWTGPKARIFREAASVLEIGYQRSEALSGGAAAGLGDVMGGAIKAAYKEAHGAMGSDDHHQWINRSDWYHGINATKRCNMWRRVHRVSRETNRHPLWIDDDCVYYGSDTDRPRADPPALPLTVPGETERLGQLRPSKVIKRRGA